jgi:hypothetical protein
VSAWMPASGCGKVRSSVFTRLEATNAVLEATSIGFKA